MAKAKIAGFKDVFRAIEKVFEDTKKSTEGLNAIGELVRDRVKTETQKGKALPDIDKDSGRAKRQPRLSKSYIEQRKEIKKGRDKSVKPSPLMRPTLSHLTLTGQLLNSLAYSINRRRGLVTIEPKGKRKDGLSNKEVTKDLASRGRVYLGLDEIGKKRIRSITNRLLRRKIAKFNK